MTKGTATVAQIKVFKKSLMKKFSLSDSEVQRFQNFNYVLIIKSFIKKSIRITLYPIENKDVIKLTIKEPIYGDNLFLKVSDFLKKYKVIHTSGLIEHDTNLLFECYLKLKLGTPELNELEFFLENIKSSNTFLNIEKIKFKR